MEVELTDSKGNKGKMSFPWEEMETSLLAKMKESLPSDAHMSEDYAKLSQDLADMAEENASLKTEVAHLESEEHSQEVVAHWLNNLDAAEPEARKALGEKLGFGEAEVEKAEVAESEKPVSEKPAEKPTKPKSELEWIGEYLMRG